MRLALCALALCGCVRPDCPLTDDAVLDVFPARVDRGAPEQLTGRWDRNVVPTGLPDRFLLSLDDEAGDTVGAWPADEKNAIEDLDVIGPRTFLFDVDVADDLPPGDYTLHVTYTPDPEQCAGPSHELPITVR